MSRFYFSHDEEEAYKEGRRDEEHHRHNWEYDSWSHDNRDRAYFEGIEDEKRAERIREEEREMEEEQMRREEERRERREQEMQEEQMRQWEEEQLQMQLDEEQTQLEQYILDNQYCTEQRELFFQQEKEMNVHFEFIYEIDMMFEEIKDVAIAIMEA